MAFFPNFPLYFYGRFTAFSCIATSEQIIDIYSLNFSSSSIFMKGSFVEVVVVILLLSVLNLYDSSLLCFLKTKPEIYLSL